MVWTYNLSDAEDSLPQNGSWTSVDRSHMVVAGRWAYVAWVDTKSNDAKLRMVAFDITADNATPVVKSYDLGFGSNNNKESTLFDLIAANGKIYAFVYQANQLRLDSDEPYMKWSAQHVVALDLE